MPCIFNLTPLVHQKKQQLGSYLWVPVICQIKHHCTYKKTAQPRHIIKENNPDCDFVLPLLINRLGNEKVALTTIIPNGF